MWFATRNGIVSYDASRWNYFDNTKIFNELSWAPSIPLAEGLKLTYDWIEKQIHGEGEQRIAFVKGGNAG